MAFFNQVRMGIALGIGVLITLSVSAFTILSTFTPFPFERGPWLWAMLSRYVSHGGIGGIQFKVHGEVPNFRDDEMVLIYANHQTTAGLSELIYFVTTQLHRNPVYVVKSDLYPWIRWPINRLGLAIIIDREDGEGAKKAIREALPSLIKEKRAILIFPDGSRWTFNKAIAQKARYSKVHGVNEITQDTLMPKPGGLLQILEALQSHPHRVIEIGNEFDVRTEGLLEAAKLCKRCFHVFAQEIPAYAIPQSAEERKGWLYGRFLLMARAIRKTRNSEAQNSTHLADVA